LGGAALPHVSGPEHANPEIEQLSRSRWPLTLLLSSHGSAR